MQSKLTEFKKPIDTDLLYLLEKLTESVKSGETVGLVVLMGMKGNHISFMSAGDMQYGETLASFEDWKFRQTVIRNTEAKK